MSWANEIFRKMSLEEKVGHVIICRGLEYTDSMEKMLREGRLGGVGGVTIRQICNQEPEKILDYINQILSISKIPPFLFFDCEKGITDMFPIGTPFPDSMAVGATHDPDLAYRIGKAIAEEARMIGFTLICNPVLDVNSNPDNPIIGTRSFGDRANFVTEFGARYIKGVQEAFVIPTGKHFPGHGDTSVDSHISLPIVYHDKKHLDEVELKPFRELAEKGMKGIMTAHIYYPALQAGDEEGTPATLSSKVLIDMLKEEWKFEGLVVSDSLTMRAVKDRYGTEKAAVMAFKAGNDLLLQDYETDPEITFNALLRAVKEGEISMDELDTAVMKILKMKEWCGVDKIDGILPDIQYKLNHHKDHIALSKQIAQNSVTLFENKSLPINPKGKTLLLAVRSDALLKAARDMGTAIPKKSGYLYESVKRYQPDADLMTVEEDPTPEEIDNIMEQVKKYDTVLFVSFVRILSYKKGSGTMPPSQIRLVQMLHEAGKDISTVIVGNPYVIRELPDSGNMLCSYSDCMYSIDAAVDILYGKAKAAGRLPVTINEKYSFGYGLA